MRVSECNSALIVLTDNNTHVLSCWGDSACMHVFCAFSVTTSSKGNEGWREEVICVCACVFGGRLVLNAYLIDLSLIFFFRVECTEHVSEHNHHINVELC